MEALMSTTTAWRRSTIRERKLDSISQLPAVNRHDEPTQRLHRRVTAFS
jgi:hypothetical protein